MKFIIFTITAILVFNGFSSTFFIHYNNEKGEAIPCSNIVSIQDDKQWYEKPMKIIWFNGTFHKGEVGIRITKRKDAWSFHDNLQKIDITRYLKKGHLGKIDVELKWECTSKNYADLDIWWWTPQIGGRFTWKSNNISSVGCKEKITFYCMRDLGLPIQVGVMSWNGIISSELPFTEKITIYEEPSLMNVSVTGDSIAWIEKYAVKEVGNYTYVPIGSEFRSILRMVPKTITLNKREGAIYIGDLIYINYRVTLDVDKPVTIGAECKVTLPNGKIVNLKSWDLHHRYAPISEDHTPPYPEWGKAWWKACSLFGCPEIPSSIHTFTPENNSYTFKWTFRAGMFGKYKINVGLKNAPNFKKSLNFTVNEPEAYQNKYALIFTNDVGGYDLECDLWCNNYEMYHVLVNRYNFPASNVFSLMDATCTKENLTALMDWLIKNTDENATIVIWFGCHGSSGINTDDDLEPIDGFLCLWNSPNNLTQWYIPLSDGEIAEFLANLKSKKVLLGGDACHGGEFGGKLDIGEKLNKIFGEPYIDRDGVIIAVGAPWFWVESVSNEGGSIFTLWFSAALLGVKDFRGKTADDYGNKNGKISVEEAFKWTRINILTDHPIFPPDFNDKYKGEMYLD